MNELQTRIKTLLAIFDRWLDDENEYLLRAVHKTVEEGYFSFPDVQFALKALRENLHREAMEKWVRRADISDKNDARGKNVLCLHAGNLPLVGFQDILAVLLSGARYTGKISRNDPYLLPTFLNEVKKTEIWGSADVQWCHRLKDIEDMQNDRILFAGSRKSVPGVKQVVTRFNLKKKKATYLIRTAHFSMAYLDRKDGDQLKNLTEAILRYGGKGCRSVAVVVSPFSLDSLKKGLEEHIETFWEENPQHKKPMPKLRQRFVYNKALRRTQLWLDDFMLQVDGLELDQDFICYWIQGGAEKIDALSKRFGTQLQNIYITQPDAILPGLEESKEIELLSNAQQPPIYWKPDGTDVLQWLCR